MDSVKDKILYYLLLPLSWLYGLVIRLRNKLFDWSILKSEEFDVPIISVGNLTVGGTGKTPFVEYLIEHLSSEYNIAVLSRGYKRQTKGFVLATNKSTPKTIGDEFYQIYQKYGYKVKIAVCENRSKGIKELINLGLNINLIILDDAFQHRYVLPKTSVLLMDYNRPVYEDKLLPLGRLRENIEAVSRADFVVVTKCPETLTPIDFRLIKKRLELFAFQRLYFSKIAYGSLTPVFDDVQSYSIYLSQLTKNDTIMLLTGIANPRSFVKYFNQFECKIKICHYSDHHDFSRSDILNISKVFTQISSERKIIITTEKDSVRLSTNPYFPHELKQLVYFIPIKHEVLNRFEEDDLIPEIKKSIRKS